MRGWFVIAALAGCSFATGFGPGAQPGADADLDGPRSTDDVPLGMPRDIPHVPASHEMLGTADYVLGPATINTTTGSISPPAPSGVVTGTVAQEPSGDELFVIRAHAITIPMGVTVSAVGTRPLVLIANTITIAGTLDGGGHVDVPGAGGMGTVAFLISTGRGANGEHAGIYNDSGGGGGAYASRGAGGGSAAVGQMCQSQQATGGNGGSTWGMASLPVLAGGGAGGVGSHGDCPNAKIGAGGGAIQLSALSSLSITGVVNVGGGGGGAGIECGTNDAGAASGGGSGGAIYLDAPTIMQSGAIAANGGGGGGGASSPGSSGTNGADGAATATYAIGGGAGGSYGGAGGRGGVGNTPPTNGGNNYCDGNAGGGGGGVGRLVVHAPTSGVSGAGLQSPTATLDTAGF